MVKENILKIKERIDYICSQIKRDPEKITIVAVSKGRSAEQIKEVIEVDITDIGENRVQEAVLKYNAIRDTCLPAGKAQYAIRLKWHMVGHLQTNKVKQAVEVFDLLQSVDSIRLAREIDRQAAGINKIQDILMEVNTSGETTKFGLKPDEIVEVIKEITKLNHIKIKGLMTIAPLVDNPEKARPYFRLLKELRDKINDMRLAISDMPILSMGMTDDFEVAIEEGANMVRLGRAIFESGK